MRTYVALRNIFVLVHAVFCFVSALLGRKAKLSLIFKQVCEKAKRFYEIATFFHYAIADGIHRLLSASPRGPYPLPTSQNTNQLLLDFAKRPT